MTLGVNYIFGKPGSGKSVLSDEIEEGFLLNDGFKSIPVNNSNLEEIISNLDEYKNTLIIIQSNNVALKQMKALRKFIENPDFIRGVVIQSELKPDDELAKYCDKIYETGLPVFSWVTQIGENEWEAKAANTDKVARALNKIQVCELVRNYRSRPGGLIYSEKN